MHSSTCFELLYIYIYTSEVYLNIFLNSFLHTPVNINSIMSVKSYLLPYTSDKINYMYISYITV